MLRKFVTHVYGNPFIYCLLLLALLKSATIQTDATPYGDGRRIMVWLAYLQESANGFAHWLPFRNGGMPLFADPEQFWALMPFVNASSPNANLQLNILLYIYCILPYLPAWFVAKRIGIAPVWAGLAALFVSFNGYMIITEQSARFATFINFTTLLAVLAILLRPQKGLRDFIEITILVGVCLSVGFQYAIVHILLIYSFLLFSRRSSNTTTSRHFFRASLITAVIGVVSIMLAMVLILPVFGHLLDIRTQQGQFFYLPNLKNGLESFLGLVLPFTTKGDPVFTSLLFIPAIVIAWSFGMPEKMKKLAVKLSLPVAFCFLFLLMVLPVAGPPLATIYANIPIISTIRQLVYALGVLSIFIPFFAFGIFAFVKDRKTTALGKAGRVLCSSYFLLSAISALAFGLGKQNLTSDIAVIAGSILLLIMALYLLMPRLFKYDVLKNFHTFGSLGFVLAFISILFLVPSAFYERHPDRPNLKLHVTNERQFSEFRKIISEDPAQYSKVLTSASGNQLGFLYASTRTIGGFSTYMPESFSYVMRLLSPKIDWKTQRPHWVKRVPCKDYDATALEMMNVNYLICVKKRVATNLPKGFEIVANQNRYALLKRSDVSAQSLRVYCRYRVAQQTNPDLQRDDILDAYSKRQLLIPEDFEETKQDANCPNGDFANADVVIKTDKPDEMVLEVSTKQNGTLVIPDNYNAGWRATVNGSLQTVLPAFFAFRGVRVEAGNNIVKLEYRDRYFETGALVSGVTLALLCFIWIMSFVFSFKRRKENHVSSN